MNVNNILVIDDDKDIRILFERMLHDKYTVTTKSNGKDAVDELRKNDYDVVFIDVVMTAMDGIETLKKIKSIKPDIIAIMMTGYSVMDDIKAAVEMSAFDYLYKPFKKDDILNNLEKIKSIEKTDTIKMAKIKKEVQSNIDQYSEDKQLNSPPTEYLAKRKRRVLPIAPLSQKKIQFKYLKMTLVTVIIPLLLSAFGIYLIFNLVLGTAQLGRYAEERLTEVFFWINIFFGVILVLSLAFASYVSLIMSHKIAGPLYRIEMSIAKMLQGNVFQIKIRKEDELQDLVKLINELIDKKIANRN